MKIALLILGGVVGLAVALFVAALVVARLRTPSAERIELGVTDGRLEPCPDTPNCVSTMAEDPTHRVEPIHYGVTSEEAMRAARKALESLARVRIIRQEQRYIRAEARTSVFRFIDDVEIFVPEGQSVAHYRSASRAGRGDFGVNRSRYREFRDLFRGAMEGEAEGD